ncbi:Nn.00g039080.m01.CDS01 [Neocucurbitaria sp. VM-36]
MEPYREGIRDKATPAAAAWLASLIENEGNRPRAGPCKLWKVTYPAWDGTFTEGYTSREDCANQCKDHFGWAVEEEYAEKIDKTKPFNPHGGWLYLQPRSSMEAGPPKKEQSTMWCNPPNNFNAPDPGLDVDQWNKVWIQQGLYFAIELRKDLPASAKTGPLKTFVLPIGSARAVSESKGLNLHVDYLHGWERYVLPLEALEWIRKSAGYTEIPGLLTEAGYNARFMSLAQTYG